MAHWEPSQQTRSVLDHHLQLIHHRSQVEGKPFRNCIVGDAICESFLKRSEGQPSWNSGRFRDFDILNASSSADRLDNVAWRVRQLFKEFKPQVVVLMIGTSHLASTRDSADWIFERIGDIAAEIIGLVPGVSLGVIGTVAYRPQFDEPRQLHQRWAKAQEINGMLGGLIERFPQTRIVVVPEVAERLNCIPTPEDGEKCGITVRDHRSPMPRLNLHGYAYVVQTFKDLFGQLAQQPVPRSNFYNNSHQPPPRYRQQQQQQQQVYQQQAYQQHDPAQQPYPQPYEAYDPRYSQMMYMQWVQHQRYVQAVQHQQAMYQQQQQVATASETTTPAYEPHTPEYEPHTPEYEPGSQPSNEPEMMRYSDYGASNAIGAYDEAGHPL